MKNWKLIHHHTDLSPQLGKAVETIVKQFSSSVELLNLQLANITCNFIN